MKDYFLFSDSIAQIRCLSVPLFMTCLIEAKARFLVISGERFAAQEAQRACLHEAPEVPRAKVMNSRTLGRHGRGNLQPRHERFRTSGLDQANP